MSCNNDDQRRALLFKDEDRGHLAPASAEDPGRAELPYDVFMSSSDDSDDEPWYIMPNVAPGKRVDGKWVSTRLEPSEIPDLYLPAEGEPGFINTIAALPRVGEFLRKRIPLPNRMLPGYHPSHSKLVTDSRRYHVALYYRKARRTKYGSSIRRGRRKSRRILASTSGTSNP